MPESNTCRTKRDGQIAILDNGGVNSYVIAKDPGDFSYDSPQEAVNLFLDRGSIDDGCLRYGDEAPVTFSFSAYLRDLGDAAYATLLDILHVYAGGYVATNWVSVLTTSSDVVAWTVTLTIDGASFGEADKTLTFNVSVLRGGASEGDPNTINVSGTSYSVRPVRS